MSKLSQCQSKSEKTRCKSQKTSLYPRSQSQAKQAKKKAPRKKEHGGSLAVGKRRKTRPLNLKLSHHITLKSHHAVGKRSLFRHKKLIPGIIKKNSYRFQVKVYEYAIQGNHLHLLVKAQTREGLQNFFRVVAGHSAQRILDLCPFKTNEGGAPVMKRESASGGAPNRIKENASGGAPTQVKGCDKNQRRFWSFLIYSRIVTWGREFKTVVNYIQKNTLELLQMIAYQPRNLSARSKVLGSKSNSS